MVLSDKNSEISISFEDVSQSIKDSCLNNKKSRKFHLLQMIILSFIPILALIIQTSYILFTLFVYRYQMLVLESEVEFATNVSKIVSRIQIERTKVAFYMFTNENYNFNYFRHNLSYYFQLTDESINQLDVWRPIREKKVDVLNKITFQDYLRNVRNAIDNGNVNRVLISYMHINERFINFINRQENDTNFSKYFVFFKYLINLFLFFFKNTFDLYY